MPASRKSNAPKVSSSISLGAASEKHLKIVRPPAFIQTNSLADVARLACALERAPLPLFAIKGGTGPMIATQVDIFLGIPVFYFASSNELKHYLSYRANATGEEVIVQDSPSNPTFVHAPIIDIVKLPEIFQKGIEGIGQARLEDKFLSIQVKDLASLMKVATYKIMFEEPPLPVFAFPKSKASPSWKIGCFTRIEEYEEASIFFYFEHDSLPEQNFVRSSMSKADASFTNRTDELGSIYAKIIRLREPHPLVEND